MVAQIASVKAAIINLVKADMMGITTIAINVSKTLCSHMKCAAVFEPLKAIRRNQEYTE
jgi:hypothetical protein